MLITPQEIQFVQKQVANVGTQFSDVLRTTNKATYNGSFMTKNGFPVRYACLLTAKRDLTGRPLRWKVNYCLKNRLREPWDPPLGDPAITQRARALPYYSNPSLSLKKRKKLLSGDKTIEVPSFPIEFL